MKNTKHLSEEIGKTIYAIISLTLALISITMMGYAIFNIWTSFHEKTLLVTALLDAIGLIVIGMAVFDVSKFLLEEEVFDAHGEDTSTKQGATLMKFMVIINIALLLEALVFIFTAAKKDISLLVYPTFLLFASAFLVISLGVYQKLAHNE